jgi:hypothetical protein
VSDQVRWNPWEALATTHKGVQLSLDQELPENIAGLYSGKTDTIWICSTMGSIGRESTLAHELVHRERGVIGKADPEAYDAEERIVEEIAARRLIPDADLYRMLIAHPAGGLAGWARALRVSRTTLAVRLLTMTPNERQVATALAGHLPSIPELFSFDKPSSFGEQRAESAGRS